MQHFTNLNVYSRQIENVHAFPSQLPKQKLVQNVFEKIVQTDSFLHKLSMKLLNLEIQQLHESMSKYTFSLVKVT